MPKSKNCQLTAGDRMAIDQGLRKSETIPDIARDLKVDPTTVTREIKRNSVRSSPSFLVVETRNTCMRKGTCRVHDLCGTGCLVPCCKCKKSLCNEICPEYLPSQCPWLAKPPFVCNDCRRRYGRGCEYEYRFYDGAIAHELSQMRKSQSRAGIDCTREQLEEMASVVRPLLVKGQSPENIWNNFGGGFPISLRTFYHYVEIGVFEDIINLNLPKKVHFSPRKKKADPPVPRASLEGRTYQDYLNELSEDERLSAVQMDCVEGRRGEKPAILTLLFGRTRFQLMLYLAVKCQDEVARALDSIERLVGTEKFEQWFGIILTDRGTEFLDYEKIEKSCLKKGKRCRVYYCDPMKSCQKGGCEKNHVELRKVIPKGTSLAGLTPRKLAVVCSHVNSYGRPILGGASPYQLASRMLPPELLDGLGILEIAPEDVMMKPGLVDL